MGSGRRGRTWPVEVVVVGALQLAACGDDEAARTGPARDDAASQVTVTCTEDATSVDQASVRASAEGVHVTVADESGRDLEVRAEAMEEDPAARDHADEPLHASDGQHVAALRPGPYLLLCSERDGPEHMLAPSETDEAVPLEVLDPDGTWYPAVLECGDQMVQSVIADHIGGAKGQQGDPMEIARSYLGGRLEPGDDLHRGGYPEWPEGAGGVVVASRDGRAFAVVDLSRAESGGGWLTGGHEACVDG